MRSFAVEDFDKIMGNRMISKIDGFMALYKTIVASF